MRIHPLTAGLALCALIASGAVAHAGDTLRLSLPPEFGAATLDLKGRPSDLTADTTPAWWGARRWHGGFWGGPRVFWGGPRFYGGGWGGPRFYGSYWGGPRVFWGGPRFVYGPTFSYYSAPVYYPSTFYYGGYFPCSMNATITVEQSALPNMPRIIESPDNPRPTPSPAPATPDTLRKPAPGATFEYDGGPMNPVPMPSAPPQPSTNSAPRKPRIVNEMFVSLPSAEKPAKWVYPAYGESPRRAR